MKLSDLIELGKFRRSHGLSGAIKVEFDRAILDQVDSLEHIYVEKGDDYLPFFIDVISFTHGNQALLVLEGIEDRTASEYFHGKTFYIEANEEIETAKHINALVGYQLSDKSKGYIGEIHDVISMPQQQVLQVFTEEAEILIPYTKDYIVAKNDEDSTLLLDLPEGLLDIFTE